MLDDEGWVKALSLKESSNKLVNKSDSSPRVGAINFVFLALLIEENLCFL